MSNRYSNRMSKASSAVMYRPESTLSQLGGDLILCEVVNVLRMELISSLCGLTAKPPSDDIGYECSKLEPTGVRSLRITPIIEGEEDRALRSCLDPQLLEI